MPRRVIVMVVALFLLVGAGAALYIHWTSKTLAAAEDCEDKPKPKDEFAMAAECDTPAAAPATPAHGSR